MSYRHFAARVLVVMTVGAGFAACSPDAPEPAADSRSYTVRGVVRQVAQPPAQELYIHHEEIPNFVNIKGEAVTMGSMAMPFPVVDTPLPADLKAGDKVSFEFEVSWQGSPPMRLLSLTKLDPDTLLSFEAQETDSTDSAEDHGSHGNAHDHGAPQEEPSANDDSMEHQEHSNDP